MQQQQHLMQMQPMMASYYPNNVTTDHIQQYLDENKSLILKIVESQNLGKQSECAENQARLQRNLMYLAAIADSQPQPTMHSQLGGQYGQSSSVIQSSPHHSYLQAAQQQQQITNQSLMAARSSMMYSQQQYAAMQSHLSIGGPHIQPASLAGGSGGGGGDYPDLSRITGGGGGSKQDMEGGEGNN